MNEIIRKYFNTFGTQSFPKGTPLNDERMIQLMLKAIKRNSPIEPEEVFEMYNYRIDLIDGDVVKLKSLKKR